MPPPPTHPLLAPAGRPPSPLPHPLTTTPTPAASVVIFDIHALQERFYFGDQVLPLFESGIPLLR